MFIYVLVQSHQEAFFSKNWFRFHGSTHEASFATFSLLVEDNFMRNLSIINMWLYGDCNDGDSFYFYHRGCYNFRQLILSGVKIEYNGQLLTHQGYHSLVNVYNSSTTTLQNSGMCSNGTHTYHSFPVKVYFANVSGSFWIGLFAVFNTTFAPIYSDVLINNGKMKFSLTAIHYRSL